MKKIFIAMHIVLLVIIVIAAFFYVRYINLDTYTWDTDNQILTLGNKQYKVEPIGSSFNVKPDKQIGKINGEYSFRVWSVKGESINDRIAITGFMFPVDTYKRVK